MRQKKDLTEGKATIGVIAALRQLKPDCVLIDRAGRAWTAEDPDYTLLDELRNRLWSSCPATLPARRDLHRRRQGPARRAPLPAVRSCYDFQVARPLSGFGHSTGEFAKQLFLVSNRADHIDSHALLG